MAGASNARSIEPFSIANRHIAHGVLATAFVNDPVIRWIVANPRLDVTAFRNLDLGFHGAEDGSDLLYEDGVARGVAIWDPPGFAPPLRQILRVVPSIVASAPTRLWRVVLMLRAMERHRPKEPHWYLASLGAAVSGRGVGSELLRHRLDRIDGPAYLESSNIRNNPLYERFGFRVVAEIRPSRSGPTLWAMWRS